MKYLIIQITGSDVICATFSRERRMLLFNGGSRHTLGPDSSLESILLAETAEKSGELRVVLILPPDHFFSREMDIPISDRRKLREIIPLELRGETLLDTEQLVFEALPLTRGSVLALWGKIDYLAEQIRLLAGQGLEPTVITAAMFCWSPLIPEEGKTGITALCDGESLAIFENGCPLYFRGLGTPDPFAEVNRTLVALRLGKGIIVERLYYHGKITADSLPSFSGEDLSYLQVAQLPLNQELMTLFSGNTAAALDLASCYAVAQSCSKADPVNFRQGKLAYTAGDALARRKFRVTLLLAAMLLVLICAEVGIRYYQVNKDLKSLDTSMGAIYREVFPSRKKAVDPVAEIRTEIKRLSGGAGASLLDSMNRLAAAKGDDISALFEIESDGGQLRLKGDARSMQAVNDFKGRLQVFLTNVEVGEIKSRPDGSVSFSIRGVQKGGNI